MRACFIGLFMCAALAPLALAQITIPDILVEVNFATEGPLSLYSVPDGSGLAFTEAYQADGGQVDGTLSLVLYVVYRGDPDPVANFPFEDIWLEGEGADLSLCQGGSCPDANTDAGGVTTWARPMKIGGHTVPAQSERVRVIVNGDAVPSGILPDLRFNSPDIDGNRLVNLTDIQLFATDFFGTYDYRSDFVWDGLINLSDLVPLAQALGTNCP